MTPLELIQSRPMPLAVLMGITFVAAEKDRVVATMAVREDLCTLGHSIHGGAVMAFADSVGAAATVINLPADAKGTTTIESKTKFHRRGESGRCGDRDRHADPYRAADPGVADPAGDRRGPPGRGRDTDPDGALTVC